MSADNSPGGEIVTEEKILARMKRKKADALEALIDRYGNYVASIIKYVLGGRGTMEDVEELTSDVFFSLWNHADVLTTKNLKPYMGAAARNKAKDFLRKNQMVPVDLEAFPICGYDDTEQILLQSEQNRLVKEAVFAMKEPDREIFLRFYYYLQTTGEIASYMNMDPTTVRVRLMRGRNALRSKFQKEDVL